MDASRIAYSLLTLFPSFFLHFLRPSNRLNRLRFCCASSSEWSRGGKNFKLTKWMINGGNTFCSACSHSPKIAFTFCQCPHHRLTHSRPSPGASSMKKESLVNYRTPRTKKKPSPEKLRKLSRSVFLSSSALIVIALCVRASAVSAVGQCPAWGVGGRVEK